MQIMETTIQGLGFTGVPLEYYYRSIGFRKIISHKRSLCGSTSEQRCRWVVCMMGMTSEVQGASCSFEGKLGRGSVAGW